MQDCFLTKAVRSKSGIADQRPTRDVGNVREKHEPGTSCLYALLTQKQV